MPFELPPMIFAANPLDRAGHLRKDPQWLAAQYESETALFVPFWQSQPLVLPPVDAETGRDVGWLPLAAVQPVLGENSICCFLGLNRRGKPLFAIDVSALPAPESAGALQGMGQFEDVRALAAAGDMAATELGIIAQGKALLDWHARHLFCSQCGAATRLAEAGYKRVCDACAAEHFPRTDPVVIMLATRGDMCLIGRQKGWPENMFSALAGFVEPGETLEAAVIRELHEEAGIIAEQVRYLASQPWPFPASLMFGCMAETESETITLNDDELAEARFVSRAEIKAAFDAQDAGAPSSLGLPPKLAIAHYLLRAFVAA